MARIRLLCTSKATEETISESRTVHSVNLVFRVLFKEDVRPTGQADLASGFRVTMNEDRARDYQVGKEYELMPLSVLP